MDLGRDGDASAATMQPATPEDRERLEQLQRGSGGRLLLRLDDTDDVPGHMALGDLTLVRVLVRDDEPDTMGHAITLRLPSVEDADALRRRLLTGLPVGTVVLAGAGAALAIAEDGGTAPDRSAAQLEDVSYEDTAPNSGTA